MNKKERILDAALKLFVENGIDATSTAKIAKEAGVASGLIFHHFGSKENLIRALHVHINVIAAKSRVTPEPHIFTEEKFKKLWCNGVKFGLEKIKAVKFIHHYNYSKYVSDEERMKGKELFVEQRIFIQDGIDKEILKDLNLDFITEQVFEQILFTIMYMDENKVPISELNKFYLVARDAIFK